MINYAINNKCVLYTLRLIDKIISPYESCCPIGKIESKSLKILIINYAHIGDVILSSYLLKQIKSNYPDSEINFVLGSWTKMVLEHNPNIKNIYTIDHWFYNRSQQNILRKIYRYFVTGIREYKKIKKQKFDMAFELNSHFPNSIPYIKLLNIPVRIGYSTGGFGGLLTHRINYITDDLHEIEIKFNLLKFLSIEPKFEYDHPIPDKNVLKNLKLKINKKYSIKSIMDINKKNYFVVQIGTGSKAREWPLENWKKLSKKLIEHDYSLVFTGKGIRENNYINKIIYKQPNCINLCDLLSWNELSILIQHAKIIIGVDSMSMHLASLMATPSIGIYTGIGNNNRWKPFYKKSRVITKPVSCSPCYKKNGCKSMECIRGVTVNDVFENIQIINKQ